VGAVDEGDALPWSGESIARRSEQDIGFVSAEVSVDCERDVKRGAESVCGDVYLAVRKSLQDEGGCAPVKIDSCMFRRGAIAVEKSCQISRKGSHGVLSEEVRVHGSYESMTLLKPIEASKGNGSGKGAIRAIYVCKVSVECC
jgi:hypothetical protein